MPRGPIKKNKKNNENTSSKGLSTHTSTSAAVEMVLRGAETLQSLHFRDVLASKLDVPVLFYSEFYGVVREEPTSAHQVHLIDASASTANDLLRSLYAFERDLSVNSVACDELPHGASCVMFNISSSSALELRSKYSGWRSLRGLFYEDQSLDVLVKGLRSIFRGELWLPRNYLPMLMAQIEPRVPDDQNTAALTDKETQILSHLAAGLTNEQIGDRLCISKHTVKTHLYKLYRKIRARNRVDAANWAKNNLDLTG